MTSLLHVDMASSNKRQEELFWFDSSNEWTDMGLSSLKERAPSIHQFDRSRIVSGGDLFLFTRLFMFHAFVRCICELGLFFFFFFLMCSDCCGGLITCVYVCLVWWVDVKLDCSWFEELCFVLCVGCWFIRIVMPTAIFLFFR